MEAILKKHGSRDSGASYLGEKFACCLELPVARAQNNSQLIPDRRQNRLNGLQGFFQRQMRENHISRGSPERFQLREGRKILSAVAALS